MEILGIGPLEVIFILLIALIVLGPTNMVKAGRTIGRFLRKIITSPSWRTLQHASRDLRYLPNKLIRDAGLDEFKKDLDQMKEIPRQISLNNIDADIKEWSDEISTWTTPPPSVGTPNEPLLSSSRKEPPDELSNDSEQG